MSTHIEENKNGSQFRDEDLQSLREWLKKQPHLPPVSDKMLLTFGHSCFYRMEATKTVIDNYFTVRTRAPEFFSNRDPTKDTLKTSLDVCCYCLLPASTLEGHRVIFCQLLRTDPSEYIFADALKWFTMLVDMIVENEPLAPGYRMIFDMTGLTLGHVNCLSIGLLEKILFYVQEAMPIRLTGIHYVNTVPFINIIMNMMKPFMKKELMDKLHFHTSNLEPLFKFIPQSVLPKEYGGDAGPVSKLHELSKATLVKNKDWLIETEAFKADETKRLNTSHLSEGIFGVDGSFKRLDID